MQEFASQKFTTTAPAVVYTMHDYLDELQYTNTLENIDKFWTNKQQNMKEILSPYTFGSKKAFMSPLAIDAADIVTFVRSRDEFALAESRTRAVLWYQPWYRVECKYKSIYGTQASSTWP
ncbi:hypothetical protein G6F68_016830 [Rhizopus microsporus]|nr:hypothetical protein G6F68_016830 [Rhizopus microsporus]